MMAKHYFTNADYEEWDAKVVTCTHMEVPNFLLACLEAGIKGNADINLTHLQKFALKAGPFFYPDITSRLLGLFCLGFEMATIR